MRSIPHASNEATDDDVEWRDRCEYWQAQKPQRHHRQKHRYREPLILCGHGIHIRVEQNTLLIRDGFTHYPQKMEKRRLFPGDSDLPDRIIVLDGSGGLTLDALNWMSEQGIEFVRLDWQGKTVNVGGNTGYSGRPVLIAAQKAIKETNKEVEIGRKLISEKLAASIKTLELVIPRSEMREKSLSRIQLGLLKLQKPKTSFSLSQILGIEGSCAAAYFGAWQGLPIKWSGFKRKPIPDNWHFTVPRMMGWRTKVQNARHPLNAMLNYGYGMMANQVRGQVIAAGLDPTVGIFHGTHKNPVPLVYDLLEPLRPLVDREILRFAFSNTFTPGDFTINQWGGCRLNPQMAKFVANKIAELQGEKNVREFIGQLI
jgi:CRISPR-associated protein Cas1